MGYIVEDDSSSDTYSEEHSGGRGRFAGRPGFNYSPRKPRTSCRREDVGVSGPGNSGRVRSSSVPERRGHRHHHHHHHYTPQHQENQPPVPPRQGEINNPPLGGTEELGLPHPTKEELSKSEESSSPTEDDKNQLFADTEYGHASAPMTSGSDTDERSRPTPSPQPPDRSHKILGASQVEPSLSDNKNKRHSGAPPPPPPAVIPKNRGPHNLAANSGQGSDRSSSVPQTQPLTNITQSPYYDQVKDQVKEPAKSWSLTKELFKLSKYGWYWGPVTRVEAEEKLHGQPDGAFLVRDSSDERYLLSLSFRSYNLTLHTRIEHCNGVFSFYAQPESEGYSSIVDLIEHSMNDSQTGVFCYSRARTPGSPSFPVRLTKPVSRFTHVRSLQYLCRFVIRQYTRYDHIQMLPLPTRIKGWLEETQY